MGNPDLDININEKRIRENLEELVLAPGPSQHVARTDGEVRLAPGNQFPFFEAVEEMVMRVGEENGVDFWGKVFEHNGNIVVATVDKDKIRSEARINLVVHADEITYYVGKRLEGDCWRVFPIFATQNIVHHGVDIYGFRGSVNRAFVKVGEGSIEQIGIGKEAIFVLTTDNEIDRMDVAIQNYRPKWELIPGTGEVLTSKAIDPRASVAAAIHAIAELYRHGVPSALIMAGDEEGIPPSPLSPSGEWDKWLLRTVLKYCEPGNFMLISDGFDGSKLTGTDLGTYEKKVLVPAAFSHGKGGGSLGLGRLVLDLMLYAEKLGIGVRPATAEYCSRTVDLVLQRFFTNLVAAQWSNGRAGDPNAVCHSHESIALEQVVNLAKFMAFLGVAMHDIQRDYNSIARYM